MDEIRVIESLDEITIVIKALLNDIAESFISVGFYLKKTEQDELYKQAGYRNIWEYAKDTFGIGRSTASRFMDINTKYSIGGFSPQIDDKWRGYGIRKKSRKPYQQKPRSRISGKQKGLSGRPKHIMMIRWSCATSHRNNHRKQTGWWN